MTSDQMADRFGTVWKNTQLFFQPRMIAILLLGFSGGLPLALSFSTLSVWMAEENVSLRTIGLFSLVSMPYVLKPLWAPLFDQLPLAFLSKLLGRRRGWLIVSQIALMAAVLALGASDPVGSPWNTAALALLVTFFSASQDIVIDAYRVERLADSEQGVGASSYIYGYRVGMLVSGAGALLIADHVSWFWTYAAMAATLLVGVVTTLIIREPEGSAFKVLERRTTVIEQCRAWLQVAFVEPFREFMTRRAWFAILVFILFYKFGDALAGVLSNPFYIQIGFDKTEIAYYAKVLGLGGTLLGVFFGALMVARINILKTLLICGILQALSNLMFVWLAAAGNDTTLLALTIAAENFTGGMGTAAFVAYISGLTNISFTATQFALLTSLASVGRTIFASYSGGVVELVGWIDFFIISTLAAGPGLLLLLWLMAKQKRLKSPV